MKPENLLLSKQSEIKIGDFGWATEMPNYYKAFCGTPEYMSPEMI
jgi:aurora kinase A